MEKVIISKLKEENKKLRKENKELKSKLNRYIKIMESN